MYLVLANIGPCGDRSAALTIFLTQDERHRNRFWVGDLRCKCGYGDVSQNLEMSQGVLSGAFG